MTEELALEPRVHVSFTRSTTKEQLIGHHVSADEGATKEMADKVFEIALHLHQRALEAEAMPDVRIRMEPASIKVTALGQFEEVDK